MCVVSNQNWMKRTFTFIFLTLIKRKKIITAIGKSILRCQNILEHHELFSS